LTQIVSPYYDVQQFQGFLQLDKSSATVFLGYLRGTSRYQSFSLISAVNFYYIINKLIILVPSLH
jgi:hypothetical protein